MAISPLNDLEILNAVEAYLSVKLPAKLVIHDGVPEDLSAYLADPRESYWVVLAPVASEPLMCGPSK